MADKNSEKINIEIEITYRNIPLYEISVNLKNFRFSDQFCPQKIRMKRILKKYTLKS